MGEIKNVYKSLVRNCKGNRLRTRLRYSWKDYVKMDLKEIGWEGVCWIHLRRIGLSGWALVLSYISSVYFNYNIICFTVY
jgi:hypothetical protein